MKENIFDQMDFGPFKEYIDNDDITDISYSNNGQIWIRSLTQGSVRVENPKINNAFVEKLAFQCSNVMGTTFNMAKPFLDAESSELRMNFVHESIATNGIALVIRKTPAKIRLKEDTLLQEDYVTKDVHDFLIKCVEGHCNIIVCGETGSGKTEFVKYLASHTKANEKLITIEDTLELHLDKIYPTRDIVAMKTNNIASYTDVLVTCMRQNPKWILLAEVRSAEAVSAVRNSISSGHNILSTIHSDKASAIPYRLYSLMETDVDVDQFLNTIYRYIQLGVHIKAYYSQKYKKFHREIDEVTEFYVDDDNKCVTNTIYQKMGDKIIRKAPSNHLKEYLMGQNVSLDTDINAGESTVDEAMKESKKAEEGTELTMVTPENAPAMKTDGPMMYDPNRVETLNTPSAVPTQTTSTQPSNLITPATTVATSSMGTPSVSVPQPASQPVSQPVVNNPNPTYVAPTPVPVVTPPPVAPANPTVSDLF